jgi:hypothetical protein
MKKTILISLLFLSAHNLFSQQDTLLKNFKYRINNYQAISLNASGGGQFSNQELVSGKYKNNSSGGDFGGSYYMLKSTDRILLNVSANAGLSFNSSNSKDPTSTNKSRSFSTSSQFVALNKWFHKNIFTELGADISGNHYANKTSLTNYPDLQRNKQNWYSIKVNMGIGKGRLENVTDMQNALWLYKALQEEKKLSRSLSADELNELGRSITLANNTRVLDFRKRTQFMLETTDKFFQDKNLLTATDIRYFSSLNDILFFAFNNPRLSGTEKYIRLTPSINRASTDNINNPVSTNNQDKVFNKSILFSAGVNKYIPANLRHQNNYGFSLKASYISSSEVNKNFVLGNLINRFDFNSIVKQAGINLFFQHAIYPNTRTKIVFNLQSETGYQDADNQTGLYEMANLSGAVNYFISYRTKFTASLGATWQKNVHDYNYYPSLGLVPDNVQLFANAGIQVSL